jgi:excisionase family DNA binding protein
MVLRRKSGDDDGQPRRLEIDAAMSGTLSFKDPVNLAINGRFEGSLDVKGSLTIGPAAQVRATIQGEHIVINGTVEGPVSASHRLELHSSARVTGKVSAPRLIVHEGAVLQGTCDMVGNADGQWMTLEELARYLEVDTTAVLEWVQSGRLPGAQEAGQWRFERQRIEAWLAEEKIR